jgi:hypothetical protein
MNAMLDCEEQRTLCEAAAIMSRLADSPSRAISERAGQAVSD